MNSIVITSGGFDPIHSGHINMLKSAKQLGDYHFSALNSDEWLTRKKQHYFMPFAERQEVLSNIKHVDEVISFDDSDGTAIEAIKQVRSRFPEALIIFANGGDRVEHNTPEQDYFINDPTVRFDYGVGGENKANSSSWILEQWDSRKTITQRPWGHYDLLYSDTSAAKAKTLVVKPHSELSMQRHKHRNEIWLCVEGIATVKTTSDYNMLDIEQTLNKHEQINIGKGNWHQLINRTDQQVTILELQFGDECSEADIERINVPENY